MAKGKAGKFSPPVGVPVDEDGFEIRDSGEKPFEGLVRMDEDEEQKDVVKSHSPPKKQQTPQPQSPKEEVAREPVKSAPTHTPPEGTQPVAEAITKTEAVRRSIAAGVALPKLGSEWIRENLGMDVSPEMFSTVKNKFKNEGTYPSSSTQGTTGTSAPRPAAPRIPTPQSAPVSGGGDAVELVTTLKRLIQDYGADSVIRMTEALNG